MQVVPGIIVGGKYQVEQPLARGGMGAVWIARHTKLRNTVAIKFLDAHLAAAPALVLRFEREARAAANLDTPHVVHVHDYGVEEGTPYLVMELLRGEDLSARLRKLERLSLSDAAKILSQMSRALRRAHDAGIVHRDLKPANVFLARVEDDEIVKILDFGIAKETWSRVEEATKTGEIFGSPHYMSPEQARGHKDVDHRADIWATGVILYRMLTGRLPFPGEVLGEVLSSVLVDPVPLVTTVAPDLPAALDGFFAKALAKKKEERFSAIGEMVEAFNVIAAEPVPGAGPGLTEPVQAPAASAARGAKTVDTPTTTQVYHRADAATERLPAPHAAPQAPAERTGASISTSTSSLPPLQTARRSHAPWVLGGVALCGLALGLWAWFAPPRPLDASRPESGASGTAITVSLPPPSAVGTANTASSATPPTDSQGAATAPPVSVPATPEPSSNVEVPAGPLAASASAAVTPGAPPPATTPAPGGGKVVTVKPIASTAASSKPAGVGATARPKEDEWGLPPTKEKR